MDAGGIFCLFLLFELRSWILLWPLRGNFVTPICFLLSNLQRLILNYLKLLLLDHVGYRETIYGKQLAADCLVCFIFEILANTLTHLCIDLLKGVDVSGCAVSEFVMNHSNVIHDALHLFVHFKYQLLPSEVVITRQ